MNYHLRLSVILFCLLPFYSAFAVRTITTVDETSLESAGESLEWCEKLHQTCQRNNVCNDCDNCAILPHCCCSADCKALCSDDFKNYFPIIRDTYNENGCFSTIIVAAFHPVVHACWHFVVAAEVREKPARKKINEQ